MTPRRRTVATASIDEAVGAALGEHRPADLAEVLAALEKLGRWLTPQAITRARAEI